MAIDRSSDFPQDDDGSGQREASFGNLQTVGMVLFLAALTMLFVSGLIGYVWIREGENSYSGHIHLPLELWFSTALVIGVSIALRRASTQIRLGKQRSFRNALTDSLALAIGFLTVQTPALIQLLNEHQAFRGSIFSLHWF